MDSPNLTKAKLLAIRRAQWRLKQRLETLDYEEKELKPEIEALQESAIKGELPQITLEES